MRVSIRVRGFHLVQQHKRGASAAQVMHMDDPTKSIVIMMNMLNHEGNLKSKIR